MSRAVVILYGKRERERGHKWLDDAPPRTIVEFKEPLRSTDQNSRLWSMLTDLSVQLKWHGQDLSPEDWKLVMMNGLNREMRIVPNIDNNGFVHLGTQTSQLTKSEFGDLLELISAFGAKHDVTFKAESEQE
jgi:hypothetical protein